MLTNKTLLVVEDDPAALLLLERALRSFGYGVVVATGPQTALERIAEFQPDAMILDIHLPAMRGTELLPLMRELHATRAPAIAITGDLEITEDEILANGFVKLIRKPYGTAELRDTVAATLA